MNKALIIQVKFKPLIFLSKNAKIFPHARNIPNKFITPTKPETDNILDVRFIGCKRAKINENGSLQKSEKLEI